MQTTFLYKIPQFLSFFYFRAISAFASQTGGVKAGTFEREGRNYCTIFFLQSQKHPFVLLTSRMCIFGGTRKPMHGSHLCGSCKHLRVKKILPNFAKQPTNRLGIVATQLGRPLLSFGNILDILENDTKIGLNLNKKRLNNIDIHPKRFFLKQMLGFHGGKMRVVEESFKLPSKSIRDY